MLTVFNCLDESLGKVLDSRHGCKMDKHLTVVFHCELEDLGTSFAVVESEPTAVSRVYCQYLIRLLFFSDP